MAEVRGGNKLAVALNTISRQVGEGPEVRIGFFIDDKYPTGEPLPLIAAVNEYGAPSRGIPPRPFMRITIAQNQASWPKLIAERMRLRHYDAVEALADVGEVVQSQIQETIRSNVPPPNAPATVERKGFNRTLIDTGFMLQHVKYRVEE